MEVSFVETMRGWLADEAGREHPVSFHVHASGGAGGEFVLRGLLFAPPWIGEAPTLGRLIIAPRRRTIRYHLASTSASGETYTLDGQKDLSLFSPLRSMTNMKTTLRDAHDRVIAAGSMRFDLSDLVPFAASWLPVRRTAQRTLDVERRSLERRRLDEA